MNKQEQIKKWLEQYLVKEGDPDNKLGKTYIRPLKNEERLPRGIRHMSKGDRSGILRFQGKNYYWYLDNDNKIIVEDTFIKDELDQRFICRSYFDEEEKGIEDEIATNSISKAKEWIYEKSQKGYKTRIIDNETGVVYSFEDIEDPEELSFEGIKYQPDEEINLWIVQWFDKKGNKHTVEFDSEEDAKDWTSSEEHQNEDYQNMKIIEKQQSINDSMEEIDIELDHQLDKLVEEGYKEYCKCAENIPFKYSKHLVEILNEISKYTQTTEIEVMNMWKELFEKETTKVQDSKIGDDRDIEEIKDAIAHLYNKIDDYKWIEEILEKHGANKESEEIFEDMKDEDVRASFKEIREKFKEVVRSNPEEWMKDKENRNIVDEFSIHFELVDDAKMSPVSKQEIKEKLFNILKKYLLSQGYEEEDIDEWVIIDINDYKNIYGDKGVHVQIRNEFVRYYDLPEKVNNELDKVVDPGYFEPYNSMVWDAYIWDKFLTDSVEDETDSEKIMNVLKEAKKILNEEKQAAGETFDEDNWMEVRYEKEGNEDTIIVNGTPSWSGSDLEEEVVNKIEELLYKEFGHSSIEFTWFENSAGGIFRIKEEVEE